MARTNNGKGRTVSAEVAPGLAQTGAGKGTKKNAGKSGRRKDGRDKSKAGVDAKRRKKRVESGLRELTKLASRARKRLIKLVNKLGHASARRDALLDELTLLQEGIAAGVARFGRDTVSKRRSGKAAP